MSGVVEVLLVVGIMVYVIGRHAIGEPLRGKRLIVLPVVLLVIGIVNVSNSKLHAGALDVVILAVGVAVSALIGVAMGRAMRLDRRNGYLWGQLPPRALWWWAALLGSRVTLAAVGYGLHAHVAASGAAVLLGLGVNRVAQALVVLARAMSAGVPFAPEKDGVSFLEGLFGPTGAPQPRRPVTPPVSFDKPTSDTVAANHRTGTTDRIDWARIAGQAQTFLDQRRR